MGSMRMALEECHGLHGELPGAVPGGSPERVSFRALGPQNQWIPWNPLAHGPPWGAAPWGRARDPGHSVLVADLSKNPSWGIESHADKLCLTGTDLNFLEVTGTHWTATHCHSLEITGIHWNALDLTRIH